MSRQKMIVQRDQEGWGYRYKVRIIGLHDQDDETLKSEELPWAQVMYPITAGGGQQASYQTPNLRQGNFVFGFFLDGSDMQVPVIMGVLGNNAKTTLRKTDVVNYEGASGYGRGSDPPPPDSGKRISLNLREIRTQKKSIVMHLTDKMYLML